MELCCLQLAPAKLNCSESWGRVGLILREDGEHLRINDMPVNSHTMTIMNNIAVSGRVFARKTRNALVRSGWIAPQPTCLNVFTTDRCNFSCFYCSRNLDDDATGAENRYHDKSEFHI